MSARAASGVASPTTASAVKSSSPRSTAASGLHLATPHVPDHTEKQTLWELLGADDVGISLTEHFAMNPGASVSGIYLAHPKSRYFAVGPD